MLNSECSICFSIKSLVVRGGGAERVLVNVLNHLACLGIGVTVITFDSPQNSFYPLDKRVNWIPLGLSRPGVSTPPLKLLRFMFINRKIVKGLNPDLYVSFMHSTYVPSQVSLLGLGVKFVASEHIDAIHYQSRHLQRWLVGLLRPFHYRTTVPSHFVWRQYPEKWRRKTIVLNNPVDEIFFESAIEGVQRQKNIVVVGRLMEQKNHYELFHAFSRVCVQNTDWRLLVYGEGELESELRQLVKRLGIEDQVEFRGYSSDLVGVFSQATFSVLPSFYESFGLVAAESLACNCPVLAFDDCKGLDEILNSSNSLRVSGYGDRVSNLASGLQRMIEDQALVGSLRENSRQSVQGYRASKVMDSWTTFFEKCLANV